MRRARAVCPKWVSATSISKGVTEATRPSPIHSGTTRVNGYAAEKLSRDILAIWRLIKSPRVEPSGSLIFGGIGSFRLALLSARLSAYVPSIPNRSMMNVVTRFSMSLSKASSACAVDAWSQRRKSSHAEFWLLSASGYSDHAMARMRCPT